MSRTPNSPSSCPIFLLPEDAGQRVYNLRDVFDALRLIVGNGSQWRNLPKELPPGPMVLQQSRHWRADGCFAVIVHDLLSVIRFAIGRQPKPTAARSSLPPRAAGGPATTDKNGARSRRFT
jgi:transposase